MTKSFTDFTRDQVFTRDGYECWLCGHNEFLTISHQIDAAAAIPFSRFQANGTIPSTTTDVSHCDNLFPLCRNCHAGYDAAFPSWVLIPDTDTIQKYIHHELNDYEQRIHKFPVPPRTLPLINRNNIRYHPLIVTDNYELYLGHGNLSKWPKHWLGEPTTIIHRAARHGLLESTAIRPFRFPGRGHPRWWQTGVPVIFKRLVVELFELWAKQPPTPQK